MWPNFGQNHMQKKINCMFEVVVVSNWEQFNHKKKKKKYISISNISQWITFPLSVYVFTKLKIDVFRDIQNHIRKNIVFHFHFSVHLYVLKCNIISMELFSEFHKLLHKRNSNIYQKLKNFSNSSICINLCCHQAFVSPWKVYLVCRSHIALRKQAKVSF